MSFTEAHRHSLLQLARNSIQHGLETGSPLTVDIADYDVELQQTLACFVTLNQQHQLRGCIGHLAAIQPLVADVAENAFSAAFRDPRFAPLQTTELPTLEIEISILSPAANLEFSDEQDLLDKIRPGIDGLILEDGFHRGTFLPTVWESLPDRHDFLRHLKMKAGLSADYWSERIRVSRYTTESFSDH